ncbi:MAG: DUF429 domain-containing protein [Thermofilaceae archaeon]
MSTFKSLGVDLAGSEKRPTGLCLLDDTMTAKTQVLYTDNSLIRFIQSASPDVVAVDAPLSIPYGRKGINDAGGPHLRECDKTMLAMGIRFFPVTLGPMRILTIRGIRLKNVLEAYGFIVIEVYPGGAQDLLGIPRKGMGLEKLKNGLEALGIKGLTDTQTGDELDAVTAAYVGLLYLKGEATVLEGVDGAIVMPKISLEYFKQSRKNIARFNFRK